MNNTIRFLLITLLIGLYTPGAFTERWVGNTNKTGNLKAGAAGCSSGATFNYLTINNVRARINTGGDMWWNLKDKAEYFIPSNALTTSMFSASLWIGGLDVNGQLKLAAQRYRADGDDFWTGPLTTDGTAAVEAATCAQYDKHFIITRAEVDEFINYWNSPNKAEEFPGYSIPKSILEWPAHGDVSVNQSYYLAPFKDIDGDGDYNPENGDYPYYDIENSLCHSPEPTPDTEIGDVFGGILADQVIKGDQTLWWVFNDKGNFHSETQGAAIGMEIRGQAFGFATNDEINNMTFYSYEIINRSTFRLTQTYFSQWVDTDLGYAWDDYVGCDIDRGLGYSYNGRAVDGTGQVEAYGIQPPAIGVDFFQGPYLDPDNYDNPSFFGNSAEGPTFAGDCSIVGLDGSIIEMTWGPSDDPISAPVKVSSAAINGINFGNGIVDDERFGMRRFVYHDNCGSGPVCDPSIAPEYYNFLRGIWKDNTKMQYGGDAHSNGVVGPETDFMFPGNTDPCNWGTKGQPPNGGFNQNGKYWTEEQVGNNPSDRRFMQSAGPFTLESGAVNYITVGIPWAKASSGGPWASVELLRVVDDKCQALFDNCFKVLDGPDAPDLTFQEMDRKLIAFITNRKGSNNFKEGYAEIDPNIKSPDTLFGADRYDSIYRFEGYQVFQLRDANVTAESIHDPDLVRLVAQMDIKNGVGKLVNYYYNQELNANVPVMEVDGGDEGIKHSFEIYDDKFATKDKNLVNHKQYYYLVVAYSYNNFRPYSQEPSVVNGLYGQKKTYLAGRKNIKTYTAIPHIPIDGIVLNAQYGDGPQITRIQGQGNGGAELEMLDASINEVMAKEPVSESNPYGSANYPIVYKPVYVKGKGPIDVKVIDPLSVKSGKYTLSFIRPSQFTNNDSSQFLSSAWVLEDEAGNKYFSDTTINIVNEQLIPELGIAINISQIAYPGDSLSVNNGLITSSIKFADSSNIWYSSVVDSDVPADPENWIRAGIYKDDNNPGFNDWDMGSDTPWDRNANYEKIIGGSWAPYGLVATAGQSVAGPAYNTLSKLTSPLRGNASINVVLTADKSKWTRCPVIEMQANSVLSQGNAKQFALRNSPSIDKDGNFANINDAPSNNPADANYISAKGMGWFPGYVINIETGERLNVMYGEDSWLAGENGRDMKFNPSPNYYSSLFGNPVFGGKHYLYVMSHQKITYQGIPFNFPAYDAGSYLMELLPLTPDVLYKTAIYASTMWVNIPLSVEGKTWLPEGNDLTVKIRVAKPYERFFSTPWAADAMDPDTFNHNFPVYEFSMDDMAASFNDQAKLSSDLDLINVVPNPYYASAYGPGYEQDQIDSRVKIINLPQRCVVTIYSLNGSLIRQYNVDKSGIDLPRGSQQGVNTEARTSIDWDLKNFAGIPIAGGLYLIHVKETGANKGERVIKWFGSLRPIDLNTF